MVEAESVLDILIIVVAVILVLSLCGLLIFGMVDEITGIFYSRRRRAKSTWRVRVLNKERPLYSLKAFRALGGELDSMDMPRIGKYYVMLSFRDWYRLSKEKDKAIARHNREELEKRILATRIEIANYCKEKAE